MAIDQSTQDHMSMLLGITHIINHAEDRDSLLGQVGQAVVDVLQAQQYSAYVFDTVQEQFLLCEAASSNTQPSHYFAPVLDSINEAYLHQAIARQQSVFELPSTSDSDQGTCMLFPLMVRYQVLGVLLVGIEQKQTSLFSDLLPLMVSIGQMTAVALENLHMRESLARLETESERLQDVTVALLEHHTLEDVIDLVSLSLKQLVGAEQSMVFLLEDDTWLRPVMSRNATIDSHPAIPVAQSYIGKAVQTGNPVIRDFIGPDPRNPDIGDVAVALLAVPLQIDTITIGVLAAIDKPGQFTQDDVRVISRFADQAAIAIEHARLARQVEHLAVVEERQRLARDLHDAVTQAVYSVTLFAQAGRQTLASRAFDDTEHYLTRIGTMAHQALQELRLLIHELRPPILARDGLVTALRQRLAMVEERVGLRARLIADLPVPLPVDIEDALYRIAQECLNNVVKHANAMAVVIELQTDATVVILRVTDDGCGFVPTDATINNGVGLSSMRERSAKLDGNCQIFSNPAAGTSVEVSLPLSVRKGD
ncbi:MAG: GAF domain-containing protein [Chloroflexota bacterium]